MSKPLTAKKIAAELVSGRPMFHNYDMPWKMDNYQLLEDQLQVHLRTLEMFEIQLM